MSNDKRGALAERIARRLAHHDAAAAVAQAVLDWIEESQGIPGDAFGLFVPDDKYVILDEDLDLLEAATNAAAAAAGAGFFVLPGTGIGAVVAAVTGMAVAGLRLTHAYRTKGADLSEEQVVLVSLLDQEGPATVDRLASGLAPSGWDKGRVQGVLDELAKLRARDGEVLEVVKLDGTGTWGLAGV